MNRTLIASLVLAGAMLASCSDSPQQAQKEKQTTTQKQKPTSSKTAGNNASKEAKIERNDISSDWQRDGIFTHSNFSGETYTHKHYSLSYSEADEQAEWVAYELTKNESQGVEERADLFSEDPIIKTGSAKPYEYRNSGYDKGHLAPSADMRFDEEAMAECFYMSNVSPQTNDMNAGIWNDLEKKTRSWARYYGRVYVICGPVLNIPEKQKKKLQYDDKYKGKTTTNITIPEYFYKIVFDFSKKGKEKMIAFCIPNKATSKSYRDYAVSVDSIEKMTNLDFFTNLPLDVQAKYESSFDIDKWK